MAVYFKNTYEDIFLTQEDEKLYRIINFRQFCDKNIEIDKGRDNCLLTGSYRGPAHQKRVFNFTQKKKTFLFHMLFIISVILIVIYLLKG